MQLEQIFPQFDTDLVKHLESIGQVAEFEEGAMMMRPGQYFKNSLFTGKSTHDPHSINEITRLSL
jgi:hypothetical protein